MSVSKRTRFEVFKRDDFTCQYCGRKTPVVVLEIDHVIPRAENGGDEIENLVTACYECNRGKGPVPLENRRAVEDLAEKARLIEEREEQLRAYNEAKGTERERLDAQFDELWNYWFYLNRTDSMPENRCPKPGIIKHYLKSLSVEEIREAMEIAVERKGRNSYYAIRYCGGVLRRKLAEAEGRVASCMYCGKDIVLDVGEVDDGAWYHSGCKPKASDG